MTYGCETWPMKAEDVAKLETTEMRMIRWMCGVSLRDRKTSSELRERIGVEPITDVCERSALRWFGHVERKDGADWVRRCSALEVDGRKSVGAPRKTWVRRVEELMKIRGLVRRDALDREKWRGRISCLRTGQPGLSRRTRGVAQCSTLGDGR